MDLESSKLFIYIRNVLLDDKCKLLEAAYEYTSILLREGSRGWAYADLHGSVVEECFALGNW